MDRDSLSCSICLELLEDPVIIPCGHSYCMKCIQDCWSKKRIKNSCPQCREKFTPRPGLVKNITVAGLVEELKRKAPPAAPAGAEDVACDVCTGRKRKALKSCLDCVTSYCEQHLQPHCDAPPLKKHKLVEPSKTLQENVCPLHNEVMQMFCRTDQECICFLCSLNEHRGHDNISTSDARLEQQRKLETRRQDIQQRIHDALSGVKLQKKEAKHSSTLADQTVSLCEQITNLIPEIQKRCQDVQQQVRTQQQTKESRVLQLQQEIAELKRKDGELEQLSLTQDHTMFLQNYPSVSALHQPTDLSSFQPAALSHFEGVTAAVTKVGYQLQSALKELEDLVPQPEPTTRAGFLRYSFKLTLDPKTANTRVLISDGNRKATLATEQQPYPQHPQRFIDYRQVLSKERMTGRCYWEAERKNGDFIAVSYKNINRAGSLLKCAFGFNNKSWSLFCNEEDYQFLHNNVESPVSGPRSSRVGVYLDHTAGILAFYSVTKTMTLLHRVQTTFTEPLYAGFGISLHSGSAEFCDLE